MGATDWLLDAIGFYGENGSQETRELNPFAEIATELRRLEAPPAPTDDAEQPPEGFVPMKSLVDKVGGDYNKARSLIAEHKIPTWKKTEDSRRCFVHAEKFIKCVESKIVSDKDVTNFIASIEKSKAQASPKSKQAPKKLF